MNALGKKYKIALGLVFGLFLNLITNQTLMAQFSVVEHSPVNNSTEALYSEPVTVTFSEAVDEASLSDGIRVYGSVSGSVAGDFSLSSSTTAEFNPTDGFVHGEKIYVTVTDEVQAANGSSLNDPYLWSFNVQPELGGYEFSSPQEYSLSSGSEPSGILAVDLTNDRYADLVVVNANNTLVTVFENRIQFNNEFTVADEIETGIDIDNENEEEDELNDLMSTTLPSNSSITAADLDGTGNTDVIIAATLANQLILLENPSGSTQNLILEHIDTGERPVEVIKGDFNSNGHIDLAVAALGSDQIYIHYNDGNGNFDNFETFDVGLAPTSISAEDINGNGRLDIIAAIAGENQVEALVNEGNGSFSRSILLDELSFTPSFMVTGNFLHNEGDAQYSDIILGATDERTFHLFENDNGTYNFNISWNADNSSRPLYSTPSDLSGDGALELLSSHLSSDDLAINVLNSDGGLGSRDVIDSDIDSPLGIAAADLNQGESQDIAVTNANTNQISIYFNALDSDACEEIIGGLSIPGSIEFEDVNVNTTETQTFEITNISSINLDASMEIDDGEHFSLESPPEFTLTPGTGRTVSVSFTPDQIGEYEDEILVTIDSECGPQTFSIELRGNSDDPLPDLVATDIRSLDLPGTYTIAETYSFEGTFELEGDEIVEDPFNVAFLVDGVVEEEIRVNETIQIGQTRSYDFEYAFEEEGTYEISFYVDPEDEIEESDVTNNEISMNVTVEEGEITVSPNPFTPNNNGYNDYVNFDFTEIENINNLEIMIFSIDGRLIETFVDGDFSGSIVQWDGTDETGEVMTPGVYLYIIENGDDLLKRGSVTLAL